MELVAFCTRCDQMIENLDENLEEGDMVTCDNFPCMNDMEVEDIDGETGVVYFKEESDYEDDD